MKHPIGIFTLIEQFYFSNLFPYLVQILRRQFIHFCHMIIMDTIKMESIT